MLLVEWAARAMSKTRKDSLNWSNRSMSFPTKTGVEGTGTTEVFNGKSLRQKSTD